MSSITLGAIDHNPFALRRYWPAKKSSNVIICPFCSLTEEELSEMRRQEDRESYVYRRQVRLFDSERAMHIRHEEDRRSRSVSRDGSSGRREQRRDELLGRSNSNERSGLRRYEDTIEGYNRSRSVSRQRSNRSNTPQEESPDEDFNPEEYDSRSSTSYAPSSHISSDRAEMGFRIPLARDRLNRRNQASPPPTPPAKIIPDCIRGAHCGTRNAPRDVDEPKIFIKRVSFSLNGKQLGNSLKSVAQDGLQVTLIDT